MTKEMKELRETRLNEIKGIIKTFGYLNIGTNSNHFPLWNDGDVCGVVTYGESCSHSITNIAEADTIICVWLTKSGNLLARTLYNDTLNLDNIPTDDIDSIFELMDSIKDKEKTMMSCENWYKGFCEENYVF